MAANDPFDLKFTSREVTAWGGLALLKRMLDGLDFKAALRDLKLPSLAPTAATRPSNSSSR